MKWPAGVTSAGASAGIKGGRELDVGVIAAARPVSWAGTFTENAAAAASVRWSRSLLGRPVRAVVVNSGNANACTGPGGDDAVAATATEAARALSCDASEILIASTGPIGVTLPVDAILAALPGAINDLGDDVDPFARSIMTTDTRTKTSKAAAGDATIVGVAKGAAMLAPNMATMLAFIATDAAVEGDRLQDALARGVGMSFNRISVDACESTNDSVFLLTTGEHAVDEEVFDAALTTVCRDLAEQMIRDAEGGSRLIRVNVGGALDDDSAVRLARSVASSEIWRSAAHGADPNWGRIASALGAAVRDLDLSHVEIAIGSEVVFSGGEPIGSLEAAAKEMSGDEFSVFCRVGDGRGTAEFLTCDLSPAYVTLNATGTS